MKKHFFLALSLVLADVIAFIVLGDPGKDVDTVVKSEEAAAVMDFKELKNDVNLRAILHKPDGDVLVDGAGKELSETYKNIEEEDLSGKYLRFTNESQNKGFLDKDTGAVFWKANIKGLAQYDPNGTLVSDGTSYWFQSDDHTAITDKYQKAYPFGLRYAKVSNGKWGLIDHKGKTYIPFIYDDIQISEAGKVAAALKDNHLYIYKENLEKETTWDLIPETIECDYVSKPVLDKYFVFSMGDDYGLVSDSGVVLEPVYKSINDIAFVSKENLIVVSGEGKDGLCGATVISDHELFEIPCIYEEPLSFTEMGYSVAVKDGAYFIINYQGEEKHPEADYIAPFQFEEAMFLLDGKTGFLDSNGDVALPAKYEFVSDFLPSGFALAADNDHHFGIIDWAGDILIPLRYDMIDLLYGDKIIAYNEDETYDIYEIIEFGDRKLKATCMFDDVQLVNWSNNTFCLKTDNGNTQYILNDNGQIVDTFENPSGYSCSYSDSYR